MQRRAQLHQRALLHIHEALRAAHERASVCGHEMTATHNYKDCKRIKLEQAQLSIF